MVYISEKDCHTVLDEALKGKSFDITDYTLQPFSDIMGFHGSHALLKINAKVGGKAKNFVYFVKIATKNQAAFDRYFGKMKMFLKEHVMITKMIKELEPLVGKRLTSECYLSRLNKVMVLENLNDINYEVIRRKEGMDFVHAKVAVQTFADFHASSILLEDQGTSIADKYPEVMSESFFYKPEGEDPEVCLVVSCHKGVTAWAEKMVPEIPKNIREEAFEQVLDRVQELVKPSKKMRNVMCHGDPWGNNIMYRYDKETPVSGILVDFQAVRYSPPAVDIMEFLYVALDQDLREKHEKDLLEAYYSRLGETLASRGTDLDAVLPRAEFDKSCSLYREFAVGARLYYSYITRVPGRFLAPAVSDVEAFLGFMIGGDPTMAIAAAEDPGYAGELKSAIRDAVLFYTGYKADLPRAVVS